MCSSRACIHGTRTPVVAEPRFITSVLDVVSAVSASERGESARNGVAASLSERVLDLCKQCLWTTHTQNSRSTLWPYPSRVELAVSSISAAVHIAISRIALAKRTFGFDLGRTLFPISRERLGFVCDGAQAVTSKSSRLPRSCVQPGRENMRGWSHAFTTIPPSIHRRIRASVSDEISRIITWHKPWLDRSTLPFSSHQLIAELPRPTKSQIAWQTPARGALPTYPPTLELPDGSRLQTVSFQLKDRLRQATRLRVLRMIVRRVSQADRRFQSLSQIPKIESANYRAA